MITVKQLWHEHSGRCYYCDLLTWLPSDGKTREQRMLRLGIGKDTREGIRKKLRVRRATREHLVRIKDGGANARLNLVLACLECNSNRGDTPVKHWRNLRRKRKTGVVPMVQTSKRPSFGGQMTPDKSEFWKPRHCMREPAVFSKFNCCSLGGDQGINCPGASTRSIGSNETTAVVYLQDASRML